MRLTDSFVELIAYVAYVIKSVATTQPPYDDMKSNIQRLISESEKRFKSNDYTMESEKNYDLARFAIFAWIDEIILASPWNEKGRWQTEPLQFMYYKTSRAGELFFDRLKTLGPHQMDVREVYYLCLCMGFMGQYVHAGDELLLDTLKTSNLKLLTGSSAGIPSLEKGRHFPEAYPSGSDNLGEPSKSQFTPLVLFGIAFPVALYWILYIVYRFVLGNFGDKLLN